MIAPRRWTKKIWGRASVAAAAIAAGAAIAAIVPASPAVGFFSPPLLLEIHVNSPGTLVAKGAGVNVPLTIECAGASTASVNVSLTERVGSATAQGSAFIEVGCTNSNQNITVLVTASGAKAFKKGTAIADASIFACTTRFCGDEQDQRTIKIT
ncbi:MAG: hypothetical protein ACM3ML_03480 [Micromonosporaceae bacterium]